MSKGENIFFQQNPVQGYKIKIHFLHHLKIYTLQMLIKQKNVTNKKKIKNI